MKHFRKYYLIFIVFFLLDKLLLIPELRFSWTVVTPANPHRDTLENAEYPFIDSEDKQVIWNFGTSRSGCFYHVPVPSQTEIDPYLTQNDRVRLNKYKLNNFSSVASNSEIHMTRMLQLLERGLKPDALFIEISPLSFNRSNVNYFGKIEGISFFTLIKNLDQYSLTTIREIFITRMFASYRYKLSWNKIVKSKKEESSLFMGLMVMSEKEKVHEKLDIKLDVNQLKDVQVGKIPEYDYMTRFKLITSMVEKAYLASWQLDNSSIDTLDSLIRIANEKNIPVVLWRPDVHPLLKELYAKKNIDKNFEPVLMKVIQKHQVPYLKFNSTDKLKCNYFTDASHISTRCCTEMAARLTETLENR